MFAGIPNLGEMALRLEFDLVQAATAGPIDQRLGAEIAEVVADARMLDTTALLAWGRALHAAAAVCLKRGDEDGELLHDMAQRLIGLAFDRIAMTAQPDRKSVV